MGAPPPTCGHTGERGDVVPFFLVWRQWPVGSRLPQSVSQRRGAMWLKTEKAKASPSCSSGDPGGLKTASTEVTQRPEGATGAPGGSLS